MRKLILIVFFITLLTFRTLTGAVTVNGKAPLTGNMGVDRQAALENARVRAVEQVLGVYVNSQVLLQNELIVQTSVLSRASGMITNETILTEYQDEYFYYVEIDCDVREADLFAEVDKLKKSILVDVTEEVLGEEVPVKERVLEGKIRSALESAGHLCIDPNVKNSPDYATVPTNLTDNEAAALGRRYLTKVIVYGTVTTKVAGKVPENLPGGTRNPLSGADIVDAVVNVKAVDTDTGKIIAEFQSAPQQFKGLGYEPGMAASLAMNYAAKEVPVFFTGELESIDEFAEREVTVIFENVKDIDTAALLKRTLVNQRLVVRCLEDKYSGKRATFKILYAGDIMDLAVALGHLMNPGVQVREVSETRIGCEIENK